MGHERVILIGPRAQLILRPYLVGDAEGYCFGPAESELRRRADLTARRQTPLKFGNSPGTNRRAKPLRQPGQHYTTGTYRKAIHRACDLAFPPPDELAKIDDELPAAEQAELRKRLGAWRKAHRWSPNRVRHTTGTEARAQFGLEGSQLILGHKHAKTSEIYAQANRDKAAAIAREVG